MGNIRTKDVKDSAFSLYAAYPDRFGDFEQNKKALNELKITTNKRMKNKIAGYMVRVIKKSKK